MPSNDTPLSSANAQDAPLKLYSWIESRTINDTKLPFIMKLHYKGVNYQFNMPLVEQYYFRAAYTRDKLMDYVLDFKYQYQNAASPLIGEVAFQFHLAMEEYLRLSSAGEELKVGES